MNIYKAKGITRAVLPVAGLGKRLRPVTKVIPKEMLPLNRKPLLQHVIEELVACGITNILLITRSGKSMIEEYFDNGSLWSVSIDYLYVDRYGLRGPGHAILLSEDWVQSEPFLVVFSDSIFAKCGAEKIFQITHEPLERLLSFYVSNPLSIGVLLTPPERRPIGQYLSILTPVQAKDDCFDFESAQVDITTDGISEANSFTAGARWIVTPELFTFLERACSHATREVYLPEAVTAFLHEEQRKGLGVILRPEEKLHDLGSWNAYEAIIRLCS